MNKIKMNKINQFKTVFLFEFLGCVKGKGFIIGTIALVLMAIILPTIPTIWGLLSSDRPGHGQAAIVGPEYVHDTALLAEYFPDYEIMFVDDRLIALEDLEAGNLSWVLYGYTLYVPSITTGSFMLQGNIRAYFREAYRRDILSYWNLPEPVINDFFDLDIEVELSAMGGVADMFFRDMIFAYILVFLLYLAISMYGQFITTSVVTEKSSKAMEILITAVRPLYLMFGKVLGVTAAGFGQMVILSAAGIVSFMINAAFWELETSPEAMQMLLAAPPDPMIFVYMSVFFLFGFLFYAFIYAALASVANRIEDVNSVQMVPIMLLMIGFFASMMGLNNPGATFLTVLSYIPFFSPIVMLMRFIMGAAGHVEVLISIALLAAGTVFMGYLSAKIYRVGVLMYGKPPKVMDIVKILFTADVY